jgi:hypothetical protein
MSALGQADFREAAVAPIVPFRPLDGGQLLSAARLRHGFGTKS